MKISVVTKNGTRQFRVNYAIEGKQHRRFFQTREAAVIYGNTVKQERASHGGSWLAVPAVERRDVATALKRAKELGCTLTEALAAWEKFVFNRIDHPTVEAAIAQCRESKSKQNLRIRYLQELGVTLRHFGKAFNSRPVSDVTAKDIEDWLNLQEWSPATRKSYRGDVQTFYAFCLGRGWVDTNPAKHVPVPVLDDRPPAILTVDQAERLMAMAKRFDPDICGWISLCLFAGVRPIEARRMVPKEVDLEHGLAEIPAKKAKTRARRHVNLPKNCVAWCQIGLELPVINLVKRFERVRRLAGLLDGWQQDCMRHSYASYHLALHGSADRTSTELGHRSTEMLFSNYRELVRPEAAKRFFEILP